MFQLIVTVSFAAKDRVSQTFKIEVHDRGQSRTGGDSDHGLLDTRDRITLKHGKDRSLYYYANYNQQNFINRPAYQCDETNTAQMEDCLVEFYSFMLNCSLPWLKNKSQDRRVCNQPEDVANYAEVFAKVNEKPRYLEDLKKFGCLIQPCKKNTWKVELIDQDLAWVNWVNANEAILYFSNTQAYVRTLPL